MDFLVEDVKWRNSRWQQGKDDWEFYWEKYGEYFSPGVPVDWNSGPLKALSAYKHPNSYFTIRTSLGKDEWQYLMEILARIDVSQIEHIEVELMTDTSPGIRHLSNVLGSGAFSGLKTLKIRIPTEIGLRRADAIYLQQALRTGRFDFGADSRLEETLARSFSKRLQHLELSGVFKHLQHLELSRVTDEKCWEEFISVMKSGQVPNLTSLSLSDNKILRLTDLVPFLFSNALENLIVDGCGFGSVEFQHIMDTIINVNGSPLALKRLDLHNNILDDLAVSSLVQLANSNQLAQLQELDLSRNSGIGSTSLTTLTKTIQRGHLPSLKLLIWDRTQAEDADANAEAFVRLCNNTDGLGDEWYQVLHRFTAVTQKSVLKQNVSQYNVNKIQLTDMKDHKRVDWDRDMPHYMPESSSGATTAMENLGTILEGNRLSTVVVLRLRIISDKCDDPTILGQEPEGSARFAAALMAGHFTSLLIPTFPVGDISGLTLCLPASHVGAILGALEENDVSHLRAFSITTVDGVDHSFQSSLYQKLDTALTGGCFKRLQHLKLSNMVFDGVDVCEVLTRATISGNLESITSVHLGKNYVADVSPFHMLDFRGICLDGCWMNSQRVLGLADALMNSPGNKVLLEELELCNGVLDGVDGWNVLTRAIKSGKLKNTRSLSLRQNALNQVNLEDLVPLILFDSFVNLVMDGCWINSEQVWGLANALMNGRRTRLALKQLDLRDNLLSNSAVDALVALS
ncbi:unnamed protein product [Calypogeia fissa]